MPKLIEAKPVVKPQAEEPSSAPGWTGDLSTAETFEVLAYRASGETWIAADDNAVDSQSPQTNTIIH
jgi:hypothetical protein